ncbi:MAG: twin-arginine translocation signal domain-containing protein, partial [Gammaproteobacteria bacterium]
MMLTRRRFMGYGGAGVLAMATGCRPAHLNVLPTPDAIAAADLLPLAERTRLAKLKNNLLGYPVNMNTPPEAFFAWRKQLNDEGIGRFAFNNVGNPFKASPIPYNTHDFERTLIRRFGKV